MSLDEQIRAHLADADHEDWCDARIHADCGKDCNCFLGSASNALRAVLDEHEPARLANTHGPGRCAHCRTSNPAPTALIREYPGRVNGEAGIVHEHVDPEPHCTTCESRTDYEGNQPWPCLTVQAIARELGITKVADHG